MTYTLPGFVEPNVEDFTCISCGFTLWNPVITLRVSAVGLYDDSRFPGRCLLSLNEHQVDLLDVHPSTMSAFLEDLRDVRNALREILDPSRINYAVLGNVQPHVHWHVIPRMPQIEAFPDRSPWQDPRPLTVLGSDQRLSLISRLRDVLSMTGHR